MVSGILRRFSLQEHRTLALVEFLREEAIEGHLREELVVFQRLEYIHVLLTLVVKLSLLVVVPSRKLTVDLVFAPAKITLVEGVP